MKQWNEMNEREKYLVLSNVLNENAEVGNGNLVINVQLQMYEYEDSEHKSESELDDMRAKLQNFGHRVRWYDLLD